MGEFIGLERAEARIARILHSKGGDALGYLRRRGRARFIKELREDGLSLSAAVEIIDRYEARLFNEELDHLLADVVARLAREQPPEAS